MADFLIDTNVFSRVFTGDKAVKELSKPSQPLFAPSFMSSIYKVRNQTAKSELSKVISLALSFVI